MTKRRGVLVVALVIGLAALWYYMNLQPPAGVETMSGEEDMTKAWISLAVAIVGLVTALVTLVTELVKLKAARQGS